MIEFNKLVWSPTSNTLTIDIIVSTLSYYTNVYIDKIVIDNQDTFISNGPSSNPIYSYQFDINTNSKTFQRVLTSTDLLSVNNNNIYFVYIVTKGTPSSDTPCGMDNTISIGVAVDDSYIVRIGMDFIKEVNISENISQGFIDYLLKVKAFRLCILNKNYTLALYYWNTFLTQWFPNNFTNTCNCHG